MELKLAVLIGFCCIAAFQVIEGSGNFDSEKRKSSVSDAEWESSGVSPDDEDGDVVEGSGSDDDKIEGSGAFPHVKLSSLATTISASDSTSSIISHDVTRRPYDENRHIAIEDETTTLRTTSTTRTSLVTLRTAPPNVSGQDVRPRLGVLFKPGILAAVIGGIVVGVLATILLVMFIVYRMRKKDEGSYALDEQKQPPLYPAYTYQKAPTKEFYA